MSPAIEPPRAAAAAGRAQAARPRPQGAAPAGPPRGRTGARLPVAPQRRDDALAATLQRAVDERGRGEHAAMAVPSAPPGLLQRGKEERERAAAAKKHNHPHRKKVTETRVKTRSSKLRFFRRLQLRFGGTRNIGMLKLVNATGAKRKVMYVIARSMGLGKEKLTLEHEEKVTSAGKLAKRGHSEALLRAVLEKASLRVGTQRIALKDWTPTYVASTNQACGPAHENCAEESVPHLRTDQMYYANPYIGGADAGGFEKENNAFQTRVRKALKTRAPDPEELSEDESENEAETYVVDDAQLRGADVGTLGELQAHPYQTYLAANLGGEKKSRRGGDVYDDTGKRI